MVIREIRYREYAFLNEMLYQALFVPRGEKPFPRDIIKKPSLARYIDDFGRKGDACFVAEQEGVLCGAAWARFYSREEMGPEFIDEFTPELSIALYEQYRGKGVGTRLLRALLQNLKDNGVMQAVLSAKKENRAVNLYKRLGFEIVRENEDTYIMVKAL